MSTTKKKATKKKAATKKRTPKLAEARETTEGGLSYAVRRGDTLEELERFEPCSVDTILTDPPYCSGGFSETGKRSSTGMTEYYTQGKGKGEWFKGDNMGSAGLTFLLRGVAVRASTILKNGGCLLMFTDWRMVPHLAPAIESAGLRYRNMIVWDKGGVAMGRGFRATHEIVMEFVKGTGNYAAKNGSNVIRCSRVPGEERDHPTEKPVPLLEELLRVTTHPGGLVVDPFCGSGSCGEAARRIGCSWVGIDADHRYTQVAERRVLGAPLPEGGLFDGLEESQ